jgi:hypothetical protein
MATWSGRCLFLLASASLTAIDRYTRWPEAVPLSDITAEAVAKAFVSVWVARFGCPQQITTDQGSQFEAGLFKTLVTIIGYSLTSTTAPPMT